MVLKFILLFFAGAFLLFFLAAALIVAYLRSEREDEK